MLTGLLLNLIYILQNFPFKFAFLFILYLFCSSHSASSSILKNLSTLSSSKQLELMSNSSYRNFLLRQYFIDLLNISHTSLVRSMIYNHHLTTRSIQIINNQRHKRFNDETSSYSPIFTLQSSYCLRINNQVQSTFIWSQSVEFLASIELIYHIDSIERKQSSIPVQLKFKYSKTLKEFFTIKTYLQFDSNRDFYFVNIFQYLIQSNNQSLIIESLINNETCQTSHTYMIISSTNIHSPPNETLKLNPTLSFDLRPLTKINSSLSICKLKTIPIKFEDLGLAYLIIRPKEYTFTYCEGICSYSTLPQQQKQSSMHALVQSFVNRKHPNIPQPTCAPSQFADDNFLLRQMDGTMEIRPIKDVIVKQCACL